MMKSVVLTLFLLMPYSLAARDLLTFDTETLVVTSHGKQHEFTIELALTEGQREQGLMFRKEIAPDRGMLFDFGASRRVMMWMKNTLIPLDMLFVDDRGIVKALRENAVPMSEDIIDSQSAIKFVIEIAGGRARQLGIKVGDTVKSPHVDDRN